jgi:Fungal trichothecene efflux pump (TRI12)
VAWPFQVLGQVILSNGVTFIPHLNCMLTNLGIRKGINELTALSATAEMAPTRKRGTYVAALIFTIFPWSASVLWAQLIAYYSSWRYVGLLAGVWNGLGLVFTLLFYFPPSSPNSQRVSKGKVISNIDFVGGFLSTAGLILFLAGLQWGGYQVRRIS